MHVEQQSVVILSSLTQYMSLVHHVLVLPSRAYMVYGIVCSLHSRGELHLIYCLSMKMEQDSQFLLKCSNLTERDLLSLNLAFSTTGLVSYLISTLILLLLLFYKAYHSVLQRLFLYLMVATNARELGVSASLEHYFHYKGQKEVCTWVAFFYNWAGMIVFVFTLGILIYLLCFVYRLAKGNTVPKILQSRCRRIALECIYVILPLMVSFVYAWMPYINHNYGVAGAWCWIRTMDDNCTVVGLVDQILNGYVFYVTGGVIGLVLIIIIVIMYCKLPPTLSEARLLLRKTFIILVCMLLYVAIIVTALSLRMHTARIGEYQHLVLWLVITITFPISQLMFPFGFLVCFYSIKKLHWKSIKKAMDEWRLCCVCCYRYGCMENCTTMDKIQHTVRFQQQPADLTQAPTVHESTRVSLPSSTFYQVSHSNGFSTENAPLVPEDGTDTGYGSISQHQL